MDNSIFFLLFTLPVSFAAGFLGALLGIGGGVILIPFLVLFMGVPVHYAIGAGMVAVIATSTASGISYVKGGATNIKLSMFLEAGTVAGALIGALLAARLDEYVLEILFSLVIFYCAFVMFSSMGKFRRAWNDKVAERFDLGHHHHDPVHGKQKYGVTNSISGLFGSVAAGCISSLFGIGGGVVKVPLMNQLMKVPMKAAAATSNFMIGVTAATGSLVFIGLGYVVPWIVAPVTFGVGLGSLIGSRTSHKFHPETLKLLFVLLLVYVGIRMALKGLGWMV